MTHGTTADHFRMRVRVALHVAAFLSGFLTMAFEMLLGRSFIPYFGGTIYTWGAIISVFLTGMTFGYVVGGKAADRNPEAGVVAVLLFVGALTMLIVPIYGDTIVNAILDVTEDVRVAALAASLALAFLPAALFAAVSPYCVRLSIRQREASGTISGRLSGLATAGSILGTLATSFYFIPTFGVKLIYGVLCGVAVLMAFAFVVINGRKGARGRRTAAQLTILGLAVLGVAMVAGTGAALAQPAAIMTLKDGVIEKVESEYNTILVEKHGTQISLNFGYRANRYTESVLDLARRDELVVTYTRYMTLALAYAPPQVKRVALVGLGGGRTINYFVTSVPGAIAEVAELDPAVIDLAAKYFGVQQSDRLKIYGKDGRVFLAQTKEKFDIILLDAYRGPFVPFHLTTQEFYRLARSRLTEGGVVAQNVEPSTLFFESTYATMRSVFDQVDAFEAGGNVVLIGYSGARLAPAELARRAAAAQERWRPKYDLRELSKARRDVVLGGVTKVLTDDFAPVEMLKTVKRHNEKRQ